MPAHVVTKPSKTSKEAPPVALIRSLGPSNGSVSAPDRDDLLTLGDYPPECIPRLGSFISALTSLRVRHKPITVRYAEETTTPLLHVAHAECQLEGESEQSLLQRLFYVRELTSYDIEVPVFGPKRLRTMRARYLKHELTMRGELPSIVQFLSALEADILTKLVVRFRRSQFEACARAPDFGYLLQLVQSAYENLRTLVLLETEEHARFFDVSLTTVLRPLYSLRRLEDVELRLEKSSLHAPDGDIEKLANAWRNLRRLVLACPRCTAMPTLDSLYTLADMCRCLLQLVLPQLDLSDLGEDIKRRPPKEPMDDAVGHPLRVFGVACNSTTRIADSQATRIARCIDSLFPYIDVTESWVHDNSVETLLSDWYLIWVNIMATKALRKCAPGRAYLDRA
ncbi:hypothetical protein TRAPUB_11607 [Trametes pubescens]|uniref:Uncharacterized protein n=1 Tax=Trametes pubescens TaxID=154538 RepID=A0A1M2VWD0_TRAPU|nr:hypothetical protein TRAPUB_11607 [Trametes pubescens]